MTRARRDKVEGFELSEDEPKSEAEEPAPTPTNEIPPPLTIEAFRWLYAPGITQLQYQSGGVWVTVPSVRFDEAGY